MGNPEGIRDEHREAYREKRYEDIPPRVLNVLREKDKAAEAEQAPVAKEKEQKVK